MPSKSKSKGNKFELDMCKTLNRLYETEEFARVPNSGAFMGQSNWGKRVGLSEDVKRTLASDLIVAEGFNFSVECKHYKDSPNYAAIIKGPDSDLDRWLGETVYDALNINLIPLLFFKTNNKGIHAAVPYLFQKYIPCQYYLMYGSFMIIGLDIFEQYANEIKRVGETAFDDIMEALVEDVHIKELLEKLEETVSKKKRSKGK